MPGALDDRAQDGRGEIVGSDARERAAVAADRSADRLDDPGLAERAVRVSGHGSIVGARRRRLWQSASAGLTIVGTGPLPTSDAPNTTNRTRRDGYRSSPCSG